MRASQLPRGLGTSAALLCIVLLAATPVAAQKRGGTLKLYHNDNPPSASLLEESTIASVTPFASVFNNLVVFDPAKVHESIETVIPDLAESWSWDSTNTKLTFKLRQGVKWHDGQPFTARDVQCTWRMLIGKGDAKDFHRNPRKVWYAKLQDVSVNGDYEATFELSEPQPSLPVLLASAFSVVYPCHVSQAVMRTRPIGTGPFKFVEYKPNQNIKLARNPDYWKPGRPYLDGVEYTIIPNASTRMLAFVAGKVDLIWVSMPLLKDRTDPFNMLQDIRYDKIFNEMGCHGENVTDPDQIIPALDRAFKSGKPALVNVIGDKTVGHPTLGGNLLGSTGTN